MTGVLLFHPSYELYHHHFLRFTTDPFIYSLGQKLKKQQGWFESLTRIHQARLTIINQFISCRIPCLTSLYRLKKREMHDSCTLFFDADKTQVKLVTLELPSEIDFVEGEKMGV